MINSQFNVELTVRDYECDYQGIVNNATYLNYLEHVRSLWARHVEVDLIELYRQGIVWVLSEVDIKYHHPLRAGESFTVDTFCRTKGSMRLIFEQKIRRTVDGVDIVSAQTTTAVIIGGTPSPFPTYIRDKIVEGGE